ncbi:MAG: HlyD family secretion protein [Verrucomicrobia bacterium]|nr:HlyD family secretion protein [Verrucomicrobiota bacterium]
MAQQVELATAEARSPMRDARGTGAPVRAKSTRSAKRQVFTVVVALLYALGVIVGLLYLVNSAAYQSTDDAFIDGHIIPVSAKVAGRVQTVYVVDNQTVKKGDLVAELDSRDFDAATRQKGAALQSSKAQAEAAQAALKEAIAHVKTTEATVESDQATAAADAAQNEKAQSDFKRYEDLFRTKVVSPQDVDQYRATAKSAQATLDAANKKVLSDQALVNEARAQVDAYAGLVDSVNAQIHESDANLATAQLNQSYTAIHAPESGWVTKKSIEPGEYVQAGQNLFALVPKDVWVTANFKEDQIPRMRPGQRVEIAVDALHGQKFKGHVDSIQAGSGARFSLLPPENATGNYVKVVQRIPVKILFDQPINTEAGLPLGPGESVVPSVEVSSPEYSPVAVAITFLVLAVGIFFILHRGLAPKPKGAEVPIPD